MIVRGDESNCHENYIYKKKKQKPKAKNHIYNFTFDYF